MITIIRVGFLTGLLLASSGFAAIQQRAPQTRTDSERYALIVWDESDLGTPQLADVLEQQYGYQVLRQVAPSRETILAAFGEIYDRLEDAYNRRTYTELVVFLSLPTVRDPQLFFVPSEGDPSEPWTLLNSSELFDWLNAVSSNATLVVYPTCATTRSPYGDPDLEELTYSKRQGALEMALVCAPELRGREIVRQERGSEAPEIGLWRSDQLAEIVAASLQQAAASGALEIPAVDLLSELPDEIRPLRARIQPIPRHEGSHFRFVPVRQATGYRSRYAAATSVAEVEEVLKGFVASQEEAPSVDLLRDVARDEQALAPNAGLADSEALRIRIWALETLGEIDSTAARNALAAVVVGASDSAVVRRRAIAALTRRGELRPEDLDVMRLAAQDPDTSVREAAVRALALAKDEAAADLFAELLLEEEDANLRVALIQGLSGLARPQDRDLFEQILMTSGAEEQREAISAIGRLAPDVQSNEILLTTLHENPDDSVRQAAAYALGRTWLPSVRDAIVDGLVGALESSSDAVAAASASSLGRIGGPDAEEVLRIVVGHGLQAEEPEERLVVAAIAALGRMQSESALLEIERAATHPSSGIRRAAVSALGVIGGDRAAEILFSSLDDPDPYVRGVAERELEGVEASAKQATLVRNVDSSSPLVRLTIVKELSGRSDKEATDSLIAFLGDPDFDVRMAAVESLSSRSEPDVVASIIDLIQGDDPTARETAAEVLGSMPVSDDEALILALAGAIEDRVAAVRAGAVQALGWRGAEGAIELILRAARDHSETVRLAAAEALGSFSSQEVEAQLQLMATEDPSQLVRRAAVDSLSGGEMAW